MVRQKFPLNAKTTECIIQIQFLIVILIKQCPLKISLQVGTYSLQIRKERCYEKIHNNSSYCRDSRAFSNNFHPAKRHRRAPRNDTSTATESAEDSRNVEDAQSDVTEPISESTQETEPEASTTANYEVSKDENIELDYVLNTNTNKFHYPSCKSVEDIKDKNREDYHGTRDKVIDRGFSPCGRCKP